MAGSEAMHVDAALDRRVDPVAEADAYRAMLLGLLGDQDPAQVQAGLPDQLGELLKEAGPHLRTRPAHILDAEIVLAGRYRWILAQDEPPLIGYDQDRWVDRLHHPAEDPEEMLALVRVLGRSHLALWGRTSPSDRARVGIHSERGPESFELSFRLMSGHGIFHLGQMRRTLAQVSGSIPSH